MKRLLLFLSLILFVSNAIQAQDTVYVPGFFESGGQYGTLNDAIETAVANGTINNTVFKLTPYEQYVLSRSIYLDHGQNLTIVAPKPLRAGDADAQTVQESAPPQIVWTEEGIDRVYIIQSYGDIHMENVWIRHADVLGNSLGSSVVFENQSPEEDPEIGYFDGCLFDYDGDGAEAGGSVTIKADHFDGEFQNCFFRNLTDPHFRYYGRAVSFPYQSSGWHYDRLLFENCSFTNLARIVMQEGNEYGSNIHINHCTLVNSVEWVWQSAGWLETASITNSIFVNPYMIGYRAVDVCDESQDFNDFEDGLCDPPGGGLINGITPVDSFAFQVDYTDFDRKLFIGNNAYLYHDWFADWFYGCPWAQERHRNREDDLIYNPSPMLGQNAIDFIDSTDENGDKVFTKLNVDWETIYDDDPQFVVEPTNQDTLLLFMEAKWNNNADFDWSYERDAGLLQIWPLPEDMAYNNVAYKTAAMGGFPLGDLNWYPAELEAWGTQRDAEWETINNWLDFGDPTVGVRELEGIATEYNLSQNYPNPFNPSTSIEYSIPQSDFVSLKVFNNLGQEVAELQNGFQSAGNYAVTFNARGLASGVYLYRLESGDVSITRKFVLMK